MNSNGGKRNLGEIVIKCKVTRHKTRILSLDNDNERRLINLQVGRGAPHSALLYLHACSIDRDEIFSLN